MKKLSLTLGTITAVAVPVVVVVSCSSVEDWDVVKKILENNHDKGYELFVDGQSDWDGDISVHWVTPQGIPIPETYKGSNGGAALLRSFWLSLDKGDE